MGNLWFRRSAWVSTEQAVWGLMYWEKTVGEGTLHARNSHWEAVVRVGITSPL